MTGQVATACGKDLVPFALVGLYLGLHVSLKLLLEKLAFRKGQGSGGVIQRTRQVPVCPQDGSDIYFLCPFLSCFEPWSCKEVSGEQAAIPGVSLL